MLRSVLRKGGRSLCAVTWRSSLAGFGRAAGLDAFPGASLLASELRQPLAFHAFASSAKEADGNLIKSLKKELEFEKEEGGAENPESPPNEFQMAESEGDSMLRWTRKVGAETIEVEACVSDEDELYDDDFEEEDEEAGDEEDVPMAAHPFLVNVRKEGVRRTLRFHCSTEGGEMTIHQVELADEDVGKDDGVKVPYTGPRFDTLDTDLQSHLYSFLWSRGVDRDFVGYLFTAVVDKEQREYVRWLQNMHEFVAKKQ